MRCQGLNQSVAHVMQQMPAVRYLYRLRRSFRGGLSIQAGAIAADDLYAGMRTQPARRALRATIRQQIDYSAVFQVAENRTVATPLPPCPIVDAQHPRGSSAIHRGRAAQLPQQGPATGQDPQLLCQTRTRRAAQRPSNLLQSNAQPSRTACVARRRLRQPFGENPL